LEPAIKDFTGDLFADRNVTADGLFTGCEKLGGFGDVIHCYDNNLILWFDKTNGGLYRLNYSGEKIKICPDENCRNNIDGECNHISFYNCVYSDGYIFFTYGGYDTEEVEVNYWYDEWETRKNIISKGLFIYRYDIETYGLEKLIEFQGVTECELALNGRYLYAETYGWEYKKDGENLIKDYKADFTITRIDLLYNSAIIVYSDMSNRDDRDKISGAKNFVFSGEKIIMPVNSIKGGINICNIDMLNIAALIEFENEAVGDLYLYGDDIYFITMKWSGEGENTILEKNLCRVNIEAYNRYVKESASQTPSDEKIVLLNSEMPLLRF
jgi:hypothetical protein